VALNILSQIAKQNIAASMSGECFREDPFERLQASSPFFIYPAHKKSIKTAALSIKRPS